MKQESGMVGYIYHARMILLTNGSSQLLPTLLCHWQMTQQRHCICSLLPLPKYLSCFVRRFMFRAPRQGFRNLQSCYRDRTPKNAKSLRMHKTRCHTMRKSNDTVSVDYDSASVCSGNCEKNCRS